MEDALNELRAVIERTATTLRAELSDAFKQGDAHLRDHIEQSVKHIAVALAEADNQVRLALAAAESLEVERVTNVEARLREVNEITNQRIDDVNLQLRDHIFAQVGQIASALEALRRETGLAHQAASDLEIARIDELRSALDQRVARVQNELLLMHEASEKAIQKAESAYEERFKALNEFLAQLGERANTFLPREVAEAQFTEMRRIMGELAEKVGKIF